MSSDEMSIDQGNNVNQKLLKIFRAMKMIAKKKGITLEKYFDSITDSLIVVFEHKNYNLNLAVLLQNLLINFVEDGFSRVPDVLRTIKNYAKSTKSYLSYLKNKMNNTLNVFPLEKTSTQNQILVFEYLRNYQKLPEFNEEQKQDVLKNLLAFWQLKLVPENDYSLNIIFDSYDVIIDNSDESQVQEIGDFILEFISKA